VLGLGAVSLALVIGVAAYARMGGDWRTASQARVGLAPDPADTP
jgi:hypothetical protein